MDTPLEEHLGYIADARRLAHYEAAIARAVRPGDVVADLGCGTGILGLLCLKAGAAKVYAIDSSAMIGVAERSLRQAGWDERVVFVPGKAHHVELPERVDVVICDQVGYFGFDYGILDSLRDARRRFLKPGGRLIPARIELQLAAIESEACLGLTTGWSAEAIPSEYRWLREYAINSKHPATLRRDELLCAPVTLAALDLYADHPEFHTWTTELPIKRDGVLHGIAGWFDCELGDGVRMTNSPLADAAIDRHQAFLPIAEATAVKAGETIRATVMARPADQLIAWQVELPAQSKRFAHSTWQGELFTHADIVRHDPVHVPTPSRAGAARSLVLSYCDGKRTVRQIEQAVLRDHPGLLPSNEEIVRFVAQVLGGNAV